MTIYKMKESQVIIECSYCKAKVAGTILGKHESKGSIDDLPFKVVLLECPVCKNALVSGQTLYEVATDKSEWGKPTRLWPSPEKHISGNIPVLVRNSLEEAEKCYSCGAYDACAVMCGRALESICSVQGIKNKILAGGLKELLDKQVIDKRIYEWGQELRTHRNIGAHATDEHISKEDAKDLLDFVNAICDYIFVLTNKFKKFMERKEKLKK
ncbi:MAG: DUF4145 domain-containing protein [bacterium]|nr:DUF4145 domain-containing protein [bacterium]